MINEAQRRNEVKNLFQDLGYEKGRKKRDQSQERVGQPEEEKEPLAFPKGLDSEAPPTKTLPKERRDEFVQMFNLKTQEELGMSDLEHSAYIKEEMKKKQAEENSPMLSGV